MRRGASATESTDADARVLAEDEQDAVLADLRRSARASNASLSVGIRVLAASLCVLVGALAVCAATGIPAAGEVLVAALPPLLPRSTAAAALALSTLALATMALPPRAVPKIVMLAIGGTSAACWLAIFLRFDTSIFALRLAWLPLAPLAIVVLQAAVDRQLAATLNEIDGVAALKYNVKTA
jgi:hypothetical protein